MIRYPHGYFRGGLWENGYAPTITTSAWEFNNYVLEIHHNCDIDTGTERRGEGEAKDIRGQRSEVQEGQDTEDRHGRGDRNSNHTGHERFKDNGGL